MGTWKVIVPLGAVAALLWLLYPPRQTGPAGSAEPVVEILYMGPGGPIAGAMDDAVKEFERLSREDHGRDPSRPVYRVVSGQNAARDQVADPTRFLVSVAGGMPPDVVYFDRYAVAEWAAREAFYPLDEFIEADRKAGRSDYPVAEKYFKPCWEEACYAGKVFGIPMGVDDRALIYNKDLLIRAGLVHTDGPRKGEAKPPATWDELREYTVKLTEWSDPERRKLKVIGFSPMLGNSWLYMYGWMNGGEFMSADGRTCTLSEPRIVGALAFMKEVYDSVGGYKEALAFQAGFGRGELDPFVQGKVAMKIDGVWQMSGLSHYGRDLNFGVAPPPLPEEQAAKVGKLSWCGGWSLAIPTASRNKQAAWEFIRFMTGDRARRIQAESERAIAEAQGYLYMPGQCSVAHLNEEFYRRYVRDNPEAPQKYKDGMATFNDLLPYSRFRPVTPVGQRLWNAHNDATENALFGKKTPREALNEQAAVVQRDLDNLLHPSAGRPIRSWRWFFVLYGGLLAALCAAVFVLDTRPRARAAVGRILPWVKAGGVVEGARGGYFRKQWREGILCALPWIVGFVIFTGGPMLFSIVMSFCDYDVIKPPRFVGLDNYAWMFQKDGLFGKSLHNTAFMVVGIPVGMALSLSMALLLNLNVRGIAVWRTFFYLPAIVPLVAGSILWIWIFNPQGGLINKSLEMIGVAGPKWLGDENWAKPSLILMGLWGAGGGMIIWLAGLKGINQALYEAAAVDGAGPWQRFLHVTIPQLTPYIFFNLVMGLIHTFQIFGQAFIMTQGGPANSTLFYVYHLFNNAFRYGRMGYASAMAWVLFVILLVLTIVNLRLQKHWVYYEQE